MIVRENLEKMHDEGFNCAQCVACAFCDKFDVDEKTVKAAMSGFGGGCRSGEICGAVSGAVMALGMMVPHITPNNLDEKARNGELTKELVQRFKDKYEYLTCRDLKGKGKVPCNELIYGAAKILDEMLAEL